jgi:transposase InsO family protein
MDPNGPTLVLMHGMIFLTGGPMQDYRQTAPWAHPNLWTIYLSWAHVGFLETHDKLSRGFYRPLRTRCASWALNTVAHTSGNPITSSDVILLISDEYDRRKIQKGNNGNDEAFATNAQKKRDMRNVECYNCHNFGHYKSDCWAKGGGKEGQRPPRHNDNDRSSDNHGNRNRNNRSDTGSNRNSRGRNSNSQNNSNRSSNNRNEDTNTANAADIEAWAAIEEIESDNPDIPAACISAQVHQPKVETELYDSGASRHMSPFRHRFKNYRSIPPHAITAANKRTFYAIGTGDLQVEVPNGSSTTPVLLRDTLHAPDMALTIISIGRITSAGSTVTFENAACKIKNKAGKVIGNIPASKSGLFKVEHSYLAVDPTPVVQINIHELHRRLGHISANAIRSLIHNHAIKGIQLIDDGSPIICDSCEYAKMTRKVILKERIAPPANRFGDEVHSDLWGPSPVTSLGGRRYYVTFTDDHTRYTYIDVLRTKDQTLDAYKAFVAWARTQHNAKIKVLRSDRGGEYTGHEFTNFLRSEGTERRLTTHDTPQHNGIAESLNRRILERVRAVLHHSGLPKNLWAEAVQNAVWLKNRTSTRALGNDTTPYEKLYGIKPDLSRTPVWGQSIWVHSAIGSKLDARGLEARWIGFDISSPHAHRVYWPNKHSISVERDVKFDIPDHVLYPVHYTMPTALPAPPAPPVPPAPPAPPLPPVQQAPPPPQAPATPAQSAPPSTLTPLSQLSRASSGGSPSMPGGLQPEAPPRPPSRAPARSTGRAPAEATRKSARTSQPSAKERAIQRGEGTTGEEFDEPLSEAARRWAHPDYTHHYDSGALDANLPSLDFAYLADCEELFEASVTEFQDDPKSLTQARSRSDWAQWQDAMDREIATLEKAGTWITVSRPANKNIVGSKWVFRIKRNADGSIEKYKARLVAQGFTQKFGVDYFDTFSPVAKLSSFRIILAIAARNDWDADTFDFNGAYLNGELDDDEEIYMKPPPGYISEGEQVKRLLKSLYGLKQAGRKWYDTLFRALTDLGFQVNDADPGVFSSHFDNHTTILAIHVDDCLISGSSPELIADYKQKLNSRYPLTDLGPVHWLLGIKITRDRDARTISLSQTSYIDNILARFSLSDAKPFATPITPGTVLSKDDSPSDDTEMVRMGKTPYREAIGSLMYASVATRPDIAFAVSALSQFLENPGEVHWEAVKRVFRYLAGTKTHALTYGNEHHDLLGFTDADGASQEHRHAISGYAFLIDGATVSWASRKQELVTLSTAEAEYVAATHAAKECIWLRRLIEPLFGPSLTPTILHCDNQAAVHLATDDNYHARTKHIDIRFHFIRQTISDGHVDIKFCPTQDMTADILTKALPKHKVAIHSQNLGICRS